MAPLPLGPLNRPLRFLRRQLPPLNFITLHYLYFILTCLISAVIFWGASTPPHSVSFTNSLFLTVSAMTLAGLNTVNLSTLNTFQQILLFLLIMMGSAIFVSAFVVGVRQRAFERKIEAVKRERESRKRRRPSSIVRSWAEQTVRKTTSMGKRDEELQLATFHTVADEQEKGHSPQASLTVPELKLEREMTPPERQSVPELRLHKRMTPPERRGLPDLRLEREMTPPERRGGPEMNRTISQTGSPVRHRKFDDGRDPGSPSQHIAFSQDTRFSPGQSPVSPRARRLSAGSVFSMQGVGARPGSTLAPSGVDFAPAWTLQGSEDPSAMSESRKKKYGDITHYFASATGWISRNSQFHGLTFEERELLGGCEYRAVRLLGYLVPLYFVLWQLLGCLGCAAWVAYNQPNTARENGLNPWWVGAFNAVSAFNNSGMSLLDANMVAFQRSYYLLITMSLLILAGNTCYPIFLRFIIWCFYKFTSRMAEGKAEPDPWVERQKTLQFLLDHPRRCYTNLFPARHTWWLALSVITLNSIDWAAFEILNIGNSELDKGLPTRFRVIDGLFQAFAVRSGGFYVVSIPTLRISLLVLYVAMMFISAFPVAIAMRNSNVYEERSLGIYAEDQDIFQGNHDEPDISLKVRPQTGLARHLHSLGSQLLGGGRGETQENNSQFVRHQLHSQLAHDAWWIVLALFLIMVCEAHAFHDNPTVFSVFNFIFEIVSAYGCVGISVGVPWNSYSFSGAWTTLSKLILCAVMLRGRHRGLPVAIDKAVLLPGERLGVAEEEDGRIRIARTRTVGRSREEA